MMLSAISTNTMTAASSIVPWIQSNLQSGPLGVVALTVIASAVQVPITQYRTLYSISVGYGLTVAVIAYVLAQHFAVHVGSTSTRDPASLMALAAMLYGVRLGGYLLWREHSRSDASPSKELTRTKRLSLSLMLSVLYACMTTPLLYALRASPLPQGWKRSIAYTGAYAAWMGAIGQAVADGQKHYVKSKLKSGNKFVGPTGGLYRLTRHPNYTAELLFWFGMFLTGVPCFERSIVGWVAATVGFSTIVSIMLGASKRLELRHREKYGGQASYEQWKAQVPSSLFPLVRDRRAMP